MSQLSSTKAPQPPPIEKYIVLVGTLRSCQFWLREQGRSTNDRAVSNRDVILIIGAWSLIRLRGIYDVPVEVVMLHDADRIHREVLLEVAERVRVLNSTAKSAQKKSK